MNTQSFHAVLAFGGHRINAELVFDEAQLWELDPTEDELLFPSGPDSFDLFLNRFASNGESVALRFGGRDRAFKHLDDLLLTLGHEGFELVSVAFDGFHFKDVEGYFTGELGFASTLSEDRGFSPAALREQRELRSLIWA